MNRVSNEQYPRKSSNKAVWVIGLLLAILGVVGIFLPGRLSFAIELFLGWLMIVGGVFWGYYIYQSHASSFIAWLKPLILVIGGGLLLFYPISGIAMIVLLLSFYLFTDAFGSFGLAYEHHPRPGWIWMVVNGIFSLVLAVLVLIGWPLTSPFYLGIVVGISLLFDGLSIFMLGLSMKKG